MVHGPGARRAAGDVRPLLGPHADRAQHRPAAAAAAGQGRGRAGGRRRPRHVSHATPRWSSPAGRCCTTSACRSTAPITRPTASSWPTARLERLLADCLPASRSGRSSPPRSCTRSSATAVAASPTRSRRAWCRVADALDMAQGRTRLPIEAGQEGIHSISAAAVDEVRIEAGEERPVRIEIELNNSAGIFQVDDLLATKIRGTPLEGKVEVRGEDRGRDREAAAQRLPAGLSPSRTAPGRSDAVLCASRACPGRSRAR